MRTNEKQMEITQKMKRETTSPIGLITQMGGIRLT